MFFFKELELQKQLAFSHGKLWHIFISKKGAGTLDNFFGKNE